MGLPLTEKIYKVTEESLFSGLRNCLNVKSMTFGMILGVFITKLWTLCNKTFLKHDAETDIVNDGLFFTPKKLICTSECYSSRNANDSDSHMPCNNCSYKQLVSILRKCKKHLDICMYLITSEEICRIIIELFRRGVRVRIIIDKHMSEDAYGADVVILRKQYIPVRVIPSSNIMHNKFVIIDKKAVLSGSLNWTKQGLLGNYENVIVSTNKNVVKKFTEYFQILWDLKNE